MTIGTILDMYLMRILCALHKCYFKPAPIISLLFHDYLKPTEIITPIYYLFATNQDNLHDLSVRNTQRGHFRV